MHPGDAAVADSSRERDVPWMFLLSFLLPTFRIFSSSETIVDLPDFVDVSSIDPGLANGDDKFPLLALQILEEAWTLVHTLESLSIREGMDRVLSGEVGITILLVDVPNGLLAHSVLLCQLTLAWRIGVVNFLGDFLGGLLALPRG